MVEEDTKVKHLHERLRAGKEFSQWMITDDYYEIYEKGMYSLLMIAEGLQGACIQVECLEMGAESEISEGQENYLKEFISAEHLAE